MVGCSVTGTYRAQVLMTRLTRLKIFTTHHLLRLVENISEAKMKTIASSESRTLCSSRSTLLDKIVFQRK